MPVRRPSRTPDWVKTQDPASDYDSDSDSDSYTISDTESITSYTSTSSTITSLSTHIDSEQDQTLPIPLRFRPSLIYPPAHFTPRDIEVPRGRWVYLACPHSRVKCSNCGVHVAHTDAIVIAMDGACRSNSTAAGGVTSLGVFCGFANPYNRVQRLTNEGLSVPHTSQVAQLKACARALCQAGLIGEDRALGSAEAHRHGRGNWNGNVHIHGRDVRLVVIKSDSEYIVRRVTELMPRWKANGWRNSRGVEVANAEEWRTIDRLVYSLWGDGIEVRFWLVPKGMNRQASGMARSALALG
ncbi:ribonuclease H-like domain-containing protein [Aspergillus germanicus]